MYSFVAKEIDYASYFQTVRTAAPSPKEEKLWGFSLSLLSFCLGQLIEVQAEYHRKSLELLQSILPQIKAHQGEFCSPHSLFCRHEKAQKALLIITRGSARSILAG